MSFQSQGGWVGFKTQSVKGTYANPGGTPAGVFMKTTGGALAGTRDLLVPDPEIGGGRDVTDAYLGPAKFDGEYDFYARMNSLATLLGGALGPSVDTGGPAYSHAFTPIDVGSLPWLSVEENVGDGFDHFRYTDAKVDKFHLEADAAGFLMGKCSLVAVTQLAVPSASATVAATAPWDNTNMLLGSNVSLTFNGSTLPAKSFSFDINNNIDATDFRLGSLKLGDVPEKRREVTVTVKIRPQDSSLWRQALYGDPSLTGPTTGVVLKQGVTINCSTYEFITGTTPYSFALSASKAVIKPFKLNPQKDDIIELDFDIEFIRPNVATPLFTATIVNSLATVA